MNPSVSFIHARSLTVLSAFFPVRDQIIRSTGLSFPGYSQKLLSLAIAYKTRDGHLVPNWDTFLE